MGTLLQDLRFALRAFRRNPAFTAAAVLSLALGMGANTAVFSVADALLFRPLPYRDSASLAILWNTSPGLGIAQDWFSPAQYADIRSSIQSFEQTAIAIGGIFNLTGDGEPERVGAVRVSSSLLPMLGVRAHLGRLFDAGEDTPGHAPAAMLTFGMWTRRYGADPRIVGKSILINSTPYEVTAVLPAGFALPREVLPTLYGTGQADIFLPLPFGPDEARIRIHEDYNIMARLKRGVSVERARAELETLTARLRRDFPEQYPPNGALTFQVIPLLDQVSGGVRPMLLMLLGAVGFVLLIACANVANLLLSRAMAREREIGVRAALGAGRGRIVRQLITESILLALGGGLVGALFAAAGVRWLRIIGVRTVPRLEEIAIDTRVLLFTFSLSIVCGVLFGLVPAWRVSRLNLANVLKQAARGSGMGALWGRGNHARRLLVVAELALSVVLLIGAGLLIRSFTQLRDVPPGFRAENVLTFDLSLSGRHYTASPTVLAAYRQLWDRFERLPGVTAAGAVSSIPLSDSFAWTPILIEGRVPANGEKFINADFRIAANHYFEALGIPLVRGRLFGPQDDAAHPRVAIIDERLAREYFPGQDPIGKRIRMVELRAPDPWQTIVGVVGRVKQDSLDSDPRIAFYFPHTQSPTRSLTIALHASSDVARLTAAVKNEVHEVDPAMPLYSVRTMEQRVAESLARRRFFELTLSLFAALALALAAIGIYGVMAYLVGQGTREIGIRIAMGATERTILRLVVGQGMTLAASGLALGLAGGLALARLMRGLLFGVNVADGLTFTAVAALLGAVALLATYIPARKASRLDAMASLRND